MLLNGLKPTATFTLRPEMLTPSKHNLRQLRSTLSSLTTLSEYSWPFTFEDTMDNQLLPLDARITAAAWP